MNKLLLLSGLIAAAFLAVIQMGSRQQVSASSQQEVVDVNRAWVEAFSHCDIPTLSQIVADDCVITTEYGELISKPEFIKLMQSQGPEVSKPESLTIADVKIQSFGPASIITGLMSDTRKGKSLGLRFTNVYVRRNGRWRLVTSQGTHVIEVSLRIEVVKPPK